MEKKILLTRQRAVLWHKKARLFIKAGMSIAIAGYQFAAAAVSVMPSSFFTSGAMSVSAASSK